MESKMYLDHFQKLSRDIEAARHAHTARHADLRERIQTATLALSRAEKDGDRAVRRETLRKLKRERAEISAPAFYDPLSEIEKWQRSAKPVPAELPSFTPPKNQTALHSFNNLS